ncbi:hypothetical protein V5799_031938 [Amblyomma americanum]|uniref:Transcription initiation protein spt3 n=1 Tax=Amblyomma americanum TaxID=6943 RepID=A0AAQ4DSL6_AMBAM
MVMHGFGDSRYPFLESAKLVEDIVSQQMKLLYYRAAEAATLRGAKAIGIEDILFLMRKDKVKLGRLVHYLEMKCLKGCLYSQLPTEENEEVPSAPLSTDSDEKSSSFPPFKRIKICRDFISFIDQTGELSDVFSNSRRDEVQFERQARADAFTKTMDQAQYVEYCNARASSFCRRNKVGRFREWLLKDIDSDVKPAPSVLDVFSYLAYETVATIVDLSLLVKKEATHNPSDPLSYSMPTLVGNPEYPSCRLFGIKENPRSVTEEATPSTSMAGSSGTRPLLPSDGIKPEEIKEAMRRFTTQQGPMSCFSKSQIQVSRSHGLHLEDAAQAVAPPAWPDDGSVGHAASLGDIRPERWRQFCCAIFVGQRLIPNEAICCC